MRCSDPEWEARRSGNWKHFELAFSVVHRICANDSHKVLELPVFIAFKIDSTFYFPISIGHLILKCVQRSTDVATPEIKSNSTTPSVVLMLMKINWVWSVCVCVWCVYAILALQWMRMRACMHFIVEQQSLVDEKNKYVIMEFTQCSNCLFLFLRRQIDFCANNPCPEGHQCSDHGNDFSCDCPEGRNGPDCSQVPRMVSWFVFILFWPEIRMNKKRDSTEPKCRSILRQKKETISISFVIATLEAYM